MADKKKREPVTLVKGNRKVTTSLPREIVDLKAAGWRKGSGATPVAGDAPRPAAPATQAATKGGAKK